MFVYNGFCCSVYAGDTLVFDGFCDGRFPVVCHRFASGLLLRPPAARNSLTAVLGLGPLGGLPSVQVKWCQVELSGSQALKSGPFFYIFGDSGFLRVGRVGP